MVASSFLVCGVGLACLFILGILGVLFTHGTACTVCLFAEEGSFIANDTAIKGDINEALTHELSASEEATHDSTDGDIKDMSDLLVGEVIEVSEDHDGAELIGEGLEGLFDVSGEGSKEGTFFGVLVELGALAIDEVLFNVAEVIGVEDLAFFFLATKAVDECVGEDGEEPCATVCTFLVAMEVGVRLEEGFLDEVFSVLFVFGVAKCGRVEFIDMGEGDLFELYEFFRGFL